jgi:methionine sulfoxide reductase heme-binding subunit
MRRKFIPIIKWLVFIALLIPAARLINLGFHEALGSNPIETIERSTGFWALFILLLCLSLTPIRLITKSSWPIQFKRLIGLMSFFYAFVHIIIYVWLDHWFDWNEIADDIVNHKYIVVGFFAFILLIPLAMTSTNKMMSILGKRWKPLHRLVYLIALLGLLHFLWLVKKDATEPLTYIFIYAMLMSIRIYFSRHKIIA